MKRHFRKIPDFILMKSQNIDNDYQIISTTITLNKNEKNVELLNNLGISFKSGVIDYQEEFMPSLMVGTYSKRNVIGNSIIRKDLPKIQKTIDCGERPYFGNWEKGSFTLFVTKDVYQRERIPAKELTILVELIEKTNINNVEQYVLKVSVNDIMDKTSTTFHSDLLFNVNLLQETIFNIDIFGEDANYADYLKTYHVMWDFFPPGNRDNDIAKILSKYRKPSEDIKNQLQERYDYLCSLNPIDFIYGLSGIRKYFGARFAENLVVFDNLQYGNAIYILFEKWEELSQLSRTEIQNRPVNEFEYVKHGTGWKNRLKHIIEKRLKNNSLI